ncbi:unnamed protein product [Ectocarpus fasciculatus]
MFQNPCPVPCGNSHVRTRKVRTLGSLLSGLYRTVGVPSGCRVNYSYSTLSTPFHRPSSALLEWMDEWIRGRWGKNILGRRCFRKQTLCAFIANLFILDSS